jgi:periplasmic divalent cation tolerance protein
MPRTSDSVLNNVLRAYDRDPDRGYAWLRRGSSEVTLNHPSVKAWRTLDDRMNSEFLLVLCTCPTRSAATVIATALLEERIAACVNQVPGIKSMYRWDGRVEHDDEELLLIKTTSQMFPQVEATIGKLHPYELPEIIGVPLAAGSEAYLNWIKSATE